MDEIFSLASVRDHASSGEYDLIVVDLRPTAETLRLLSLPEVLSWYMEKIFPIGRRVASSSPVLNRVTSLPVADDKVFAAVASFYERLDGIRDILADPEVTSARLVMNPEKMVISEARRTYTYLGLFGYAVDTAIVNRVLPDTVTDPVFRTLARDSEGAPRVRRTKASPTWTSGSCGCSTRRWSVSTTALVGEELYEGRDPTITSPRAAVPGRGRGRQRGPRLAVPFVDKAEVDVLRHGDELFITVGPIAGRLCCRTR